MLETVVNVKFSTHPVTLKQNLPGFYNFTTTTSVELKEAHKSCDANGKLRACFGEHYNLLELL